ncbi:hypothetical protein C8J56DRAFT_1026710 [Mycena floridula]|nr:hypothetical protein C8J56DRAFT_1026710 [Mycena floridula]
MNCVWTRELVGGQTNEEQVHEGLQSNSNKIVVVVCIGHQGHLVAVSVTSAPKWSSIVERIQAGSLEGLEHLVEESHRSCYALAHVLRLSLDPCRLRRSHLPEGRPSGPHAFMDSAFVVLRLRLYDGRDGGQEGHYWTIRRVTGKCWLSFLFQSDSSVFSSPIVLESLSTNDSSSWYNGTDDGESRAELCAVVSSLYLTVFFLWSYHRLSDSLSPDAKRDFPSLDAPLVLQEA